MARTTKISMSLSRKLGDGDYGSIGFETSEEVSLEDDDNRSEAFNALYKRLEKRGDYLMKKLKGKLK